MVALSMLSPEESEGRLEDAEMKAKSSSGLGLWDHLSYDTGWFSQA